MHTKETSKMVSSMAKDQSSIKTASALMKVIGIIIRLKEEAY